MPLPSAFCWSKFGIEAGESAASIVQRKEGERSQNRGTFLWGIGNSIRPSLMLLLDSVSQPVVIFTPIRSAPSSRDVRPASVVAWRSARGLDGRPYEMPPHSVVTSSANSRRHHFALVCNSDRPLVDYTEDLSLDDDNLRNLRTGTRVGSSQVTSVVRVVDHSVPQFPRYRVAFDARLVPPYLLVLGDPGSVSATERAVDSPASERPATLPTELVMPLAKLS